MPGGDTPTEVEYGNSDTFHWTNCTPQHAAFNRSNPGKQWDNVVGLWGGFENHIQQDLLKEDDTRACILAGPVLATDDPSQDFGTGPVQYPLLFWKIVAVASQAGGCGRTLKTYGFLLSQADVMAASALSSRRENMPAIRCRSRRSRRRPAWCSTPRCSPPTRKRHSRRQWRRCDADSRLPDRHGGPRRQQKVDGRGRVMAMQQRRRAG